MIEPVLKDFCDLYSLKNLIEEPTCYKNPINPSSIDLILTNRAQNFQESRAIETGISDFHKMIITVLKYDYQKKSPICIKYRSYKNFNDDDFRNDLSNNISYKILNYDNFRDIFMSVLNAHAPMKSKIIRGNHAPFMNRILSKSFMLRTKMKNKYHKNPSSENKTNYKKQRNFCVKLLRSEKRNYFNNLDISVFKDNKKFWKSIKPLFSDKNKTCLKEINLLENDKIVSDTAEVAKIINDYFTQIVDDLDILPWSSNEDFQKETLTLSEIIQKYASHPSIIKIKDTY